MRRSEEEIAVHHFWAGPANAEGEIILTLPAGLKPYPVTTGEWHMRVLATKCAPQPPTTRVLVSDNALDDNHRPIFLAVIPGADDKIVAVNEQRYYRLRPPAQTLRFRTVAAGSDDGETSLPGLEILLELVQRRPR